MRCSCHICDTYMTHSEGLELGCVCPECGYRCKACLGTNTVISRDALKSIKDNPIIMRDILGGLEGYEGGVHEGDEGLRDRYDSREERSRWDG